MEFTPQLYEKSCELLQNKAGNTKHLRKIPGFPGKSQVIHNFGGCQTLQGHAQIKQDLAVSRTGLIIRPVFLIDVSNRSQVNTFSKWWFTTSLYDVISISWLPSVVDLRPLYFDPANLGLCWICSAQVFVSCLQLKKCFVWHRSSMSPSC